MSKSYGDRKKRYDSDVSVRLALKEKDGPFIAGPSAGQFSNISASGAALFVSPIRYGKYHLIDTPLDNPSQVLELDMEEFTIPCRPVWYHLDGEHKGKSPEQYKVGVEFMRQPSPAEMAIMLKPKKHIRHSSLPEPIKKIIDWFKL